MTIQRMDNVAIVVDDLDAAVAFFTELGMELEGKGQIEGLWADRTVGLDGVRSEIAMMRTPDGHSKLELTKYHAPAAARAERGVLLALVQGCHANSRVVVEQYCCRLARTRSAHLKCGIEPRFAPGPASMRHGRPHAVRAGPHRPPRLRRGLGPGPLSGEDDLAAGREVVELAYGDDVLDLVDEVVLAQAE